MTPHIIRDDTDASLDRANASLGRVNASPDGTLAISDDMRA